MKARAGLIVVLALMVVVVLANYSYYQNQPIQVQYKQKVYCTGAHHVGNVVFEEKTLTRTVARKDRGTVHDIEDRGLCPACQARAEREIRISRVARRWVWNVGFMVVEIILNRDNTGTFQGDPLSWNLTDSGFEGEVKYHNYSSWGDRELLRSHISGTVYDGGRKCTIHGYGFFGFGKGQSSEFICGD